MRGYGYRAYLAFLANVLTVVLKQCNIEVAFSAISFYDIFHSLYLDTANFDKHSIIFFILLSFSILFSIIFNAISYKRERRLDRPVFNFEIAFLIGEVT